MNYILKNNNKYLLGGISVMTIMTLMSDTGAFMVGKAVNDIRNYRKNQGVEENNTNEVECVKYSTIIDVIDAIKKVVYSVSEGYRLIGLMGVKVPEAFSTIPEGYELKIEITDAIKIEKDGVVTYYAQEGGILVGNKSLKYYIEEKEKTKTLK